MTTSSVDNQPVSESRAKRPLGLLVTYISIVLIYGIGPLMRPLALALLNASAAPASRSVPLNILEWVNVIVGISIIIFAILAWIGRPHWARLALIGLVWFSTILLFIFMFTTRQTSATSNTPNALNSIPYLICQVGLFIAIPAYLTWYINRPRARAYYEQ
jgi:hypothetical protein